jgi:hypothetical protein
MSFLGNINYSLADQSKKTVYASPLLGEKKSQTGRGVSIWAQNVRTNSPIKTNLKMVSRECLDKQQEETSMPRIPSKVEL